MALDASGTVYVNDRNTKRFKKINQNVLYSTGFSSSGNSAIAVDASGSIYITNSAAGVIKKFNNDGTGGTVIVTGLIGVHRIAVDATGTIYVTEPANNVVKKMNNDGTNIQTLGSGFNNPIGIAVDASGFIYVLDAGNNAVKKMNNDGTNIQTLTSGFSNPKGMALDALGDIYITELNTIKKMNNDGTNIQVIYTDYQVQSSNLSEIVVDSSGVIYVRTKSSEGGNGFIQKVFPALYSNRVLVNVIVEGVLEAPIVTTPIQLGQGSTATALTATSGGTSLMWYTVATGGTGSATAPTPTTITLGNTSYWVASTNANGCESERVEIVFTVTEAPEVAPPTAPVAKTPQIYAGTATLADLTATGTNLQWYAAPTGGIPLALTTALVNGSTYYVSQTSAGNETSRTAVKATKISEAAQTVCNGATIASLITTPTPIPEVTTHWFTSATSETALEGTTTLTPGDYYVEQRLPELYTVASNLGEIVRITSDAFGNLYFLVKAADYTYTLKKINPDGTNLQTLATVPYFFYFIFTDIAVDASGYIYVTQFNKII